MYLNQEENGFGYDPIFEVSNIVEITGWKSNISHRNYSGKVSWEIKWNIK